MTNRRGFLKLAGLGATVLGRQLVLPPTRPRTDIIWPPGVRTRFDIGSGQPWYCLTIDDGWHGEMIAPMIYYLLNNSVFPFTWFANGVGVRNARDGCVTNIGNPDYCDGTIPEWMYWCRCTLGYHTMHHPAVEDQRKNYNRARWIEDYEEWLEIALDTFGEAQEKAIKHSNFPIIRPYARAAGGYFSDAFMEMCDEKDLEPVGWSVDPYTLVRGAEIQPGDIFLTHFRASEWRWFEAMAEWEQNQVRAPQDMNAMQRLEDDHLFHSGNWRWWLDHYLPKRGTCE